MHNLKIRFQVKLGMTRFVSFRHPELDSGSRLCKKSSKKLKEILEYIAYDKLSAAKKFNKKLDEQIGGLLVFPHKYRKSKYFEAENIRDMIFSGYTIIYEIFEDKIEILTIFNQNLPLEK